MYKLTYGMESHKKTEFIRFFKTLEAANEFISKREFGGLAHVLEETNEKRERKRA
tara:strand:- start:298 stop:462 length:165 start_codon:yes stop_codon:yes gene_type:complete